MTDHCADRIGEQKSDKREPRNAGSDEHRAANGGHPADHEQDLDAVLAEVVFNLLALVGGSKAGEPAMLQEPAAPETTDPVQEDITEDDTRECGRQRDP